MKNNKALKPVIAVVAIVAIGLVVKFVWFRGSFLYAGTIEATKVDVSARVSSVVATLQVREGDHIKSNQTIMTLDCADYKIAAELAKQNFDRTERLYNQGSQPKEAFDQIKNKWDDAKLKLDWCSVNAPLDGTVLTKYHEPGEMVNQGVRLFTLANLKEPYAYIYIPQPKVAKLSLGLKLKGHLPEMGSKVFEGSIVQISDQAEFTPKNVQTEEERTRLVYAIKVLFKNDDEVLKPGMSIEVELPEG
jgi:HlyD family secretion protein